VNADSKRKRRRWAAMLVLGFGLLATIQESAMALTAEEVTDRLRSLRGDDRPALQALARSISEQATQGGRGAAAAALDRDADLAAKAMELIGLMPEQAFVPLLRGAAAADPARELWRLETLVETEMAWRAEVAHLARARLDDRSILPVPSGTRAEGEPPAPRVCDRAYLLLRQLLKSDERQVDQLVAAKVYLHLPVADKDAAIAQFKKSGSWMNVFER